MDSKSKQEATLSDRIKAATREVSDFPKPGINFYDITTILNKGHLFREIIDTFAERHAGSKLDAVVGIESRGFIFAAPLAYRLGLPFIPVRKFGRLPAETKRLEYDLEYGKDSIEIHLDALPPQSRVIIVDDLMATGGTAMGAVNLVQGLGAEVLECIFLIELDSLQGATRIAPVSTFSLVHYME